MKDIDEITKAIVNFRDERDWKQFHNGKDLSLALSIEASELNQLFLWKNPQEVDTDRIREELADVFNYAFLIADAYNLDVREIVLEKIEKNGKKYPVDKFRGSSKKYNEL